MQEKKSFDTDGKLGIFYMVPSLKDKNYHIWTQIEDEFEPEPLHINLWYEISNSLQMRSHSPEGSFSQYYTGIPRGRIVKNGPTFIVAWGNDFPLEDYKNEILREFNLDYANSAGNVKFEVDAHEKMTPAAKLQVEKLMGIEMSPSGLKVKKITPQKKKPHKHSDNCQICKIAS